MRTKLTNDLALLDRHQDQRREQLPPSGLVAVPDPAVRGSRHHEVAFGELAQVRPLSPKQTDPYIELVAVDVSDEVRHDALGAASGWGGEQEHHANPIVAPHRRVRDRLG